MRHQFLTIILSLSCTISMVFAQDSIPVMSLETDAASPPAKIEDIEWLEGDWIGEGLGGKAEDIISPAADGQMMGMFRHLKADGSINFYEFYVFAEKDGSLTQRLKHFSPMLSGWEEKDDFVEFPLVEIRQRAAFFDGLSYVLDEKGTLTVAVRVAEDQIAVFYYKKRNDSRR